MNYNIAGKNIDLTEGLKQAVYDKLGRLEKFFAEDANANITLSHKESLQNLSILAHLVLTSIVKLGFADVNSHHSLTNPNSFSVANKSVS